MADNIDVDRVIEEMEAVPLTRERRMILALGYHSKEKDRRVEDLQSRVEELERQVTNGGRGTRGKTERAKDSAG